ncbi:ABC transporter ATP-binding protein [Rhodobium gokarnense]|uniref:Multiple sugar transport system ATP-binding protein n=1 Tax=Rhodobium gokarnense TaxID=364296 RepID=A0ABT3H6C1_9HYPH|nr:ABC transporter ATP-binding protein [Rhodobium gokarnense]MCW2305942.1 multiple sugar transport system ATP-binding protein [Rhodobium gokarnense]
MSQIELRDVTKAFGPHEVIKGVDLTIADGELTVFVGPSGCGKSTLLRMIAGLEDVSSGSVLIDGKDVTGAAPAERALAMVFQSYALYPHMDVRANIGFSLKTAGMASAEITKRVDEVAAILKLTDYLDRKPKALSGGQRQRVAIGRAIVRDPTAFLFDEPLSNLDAALRVEMRIEIAKLHKKLEATTIYVTHDQVEAMTLADKIVVLRDGLIEQIGPPRELYDRPANLFVAQFLGSPKMNLFAPTGDIAKIDAVAEKNPKTVGVRPEHIVVAEPGTGHVDGTVDLVEYLGADSLVYVDCGEHGLVTIRHTEDREVKEGETIGLSFREDRISLFDANEQAI